MWAERVARGNRSIASAITVAWSIPRRCMAVPRKAAVIRFATSRTMAPCSLRPRYGPGAPAGAGADGGVEVVMGPGALRPDAGLQSPVLARSSGDHAAGEGSGTYSLHRYRLTRFAAVLPPIGRLLRTRMRHTRMALAATTGFLTLTQLPRRERGKRRYSDLVTLACSTSSG